MGPLARNAKIGFVDTPGPVCRPEFAPTTPTEFLRTPLNPAPDRNVIYVDVPLRHDLFQVSQTERISKVTTNAQNDDVGFQMSPLEQRWPLPSHEPFRLSDRLRLVCNTSANGEFSRVLLPPQGPPLVCPALLPWPSANR